MGRDRVPGCFPRGVKGVFWERGFVALLGKTVQKRRGNDCIRPSIHARSITTTVGGNSRRGFGRHFLLLDTGQQHVSVCTADAERGIAITSLNRENI